MTGQAPPDFPLSGITRVTGLAALVFSALGPAVVLGRALRRRYW